MPNKVCPACHADKPVGDFARLTPQSQQRQDICRKCRAIAWRKQHYAKNREAILAQQRDYRRANPEKVEETCRRSRSKKPEMYAATRAAWHARNREKAAAYKRQWALDNRERIQVARQREDNRERDRARQRAWREANKDLKQARDKIYAEANRERIRARNREYYRRNRETIINKVSSWAGENPERRRKTALDYSTRSRAAAASGVPFTAEQLQGKIQYHADRCWICHGVWHSIDHVKPLRAQGPHMLANLRPICRACNSAKHARWPLALVERDLAHRFSARRSHARTA